ncbi:protein Jade-1-like [Syngnathoides biaculeatus]|uniref:protein Jade-1-like n=1 Tax=Syngnathoides biaculeatus TaxID=300417 RepID=UPI002ADE32E7|nr:protein Jade-1-like [Syngnathoides biaculeatus]
MKPTCSGTKWVYVSCALWIPKMSNGNPEKMEPVTNVSHIPSNSLHSGLEMTIITQNDKDKFKYYWPKHSDLKDSLERDSTTEVENEESVRSKKGKLRGKVGGDNKEDMAALGLIPFASLSPSSLQSSLCLVRKCDLQEKRFNVSKMKLQEMEEVFYQGREEVGHHLKMTPKTVDFLYQY